MKLHTMAEFLTPAEGLLELSAEVSAPALMPLSNSAALIGKTLQGMEQFKSMPSAPQSVAEQVMQRTQEANMSLLEAAFSGKGVVMNGEG